MAAMLRRVRSSFFVWFFDALKCELSCCGAHLGGHECLSYVFYVIAVFCDMR
jgi:hypothetical protein